ncbi:MAG: enoyl-CoA hydratase/isomerase family protein [Ideonella sp.]|nr:enoyl-CoA hydratase/isomerase family protein [Ideonella sp.]MCC7457451.1 enoyl-CoA hydratase/isomerase family protein [Nitrospira sp.]
MGTPELTIAGHVATITLRRPRQANRLEPDDLAAIAQHVADVNAQPTVRVLRLQAGGKTFCAGFDIGRIGGAPVAFEAMVDAVEAARPVTIAVLQGGVYGGATDLALACDFRLGSHACEMFMPAARLGLHYYRGGLERYVSRLGVDVAKRLFLAGETVDAHEMKAIGFLTHLVAADALHAAADDLSATLAGMAPLAMLPMKQHLNRIARGTLDADALQRDLDASVRSRDLQEGRAAWAEKRAPRFNGE